VDSARRLPQNERKTMNANTLKAIIRHGETLLAAFPNAVERDPVALCKKLRRIQTAIDRPILDYTNGENGVTIEKLDVETDKALARVRKLLFGTEQVNGGQPQLFINRDPRGHALKADDVWVRNWNQSRYAAKLPALHTDMGGYGILAPDLTEDNR
jgi:hypothetical protein